jgi:TPR repeat protein
MSEGPEPRPNQQSTSGWLQSRATPRRSTPWERCTLLNFPPTNRYFDLTLLLRYTQGNNAILKDPALSFSWIRKAAVQGLASAVVQVARAYETGEGTKKDDKEAFKFYKMAADGGDENGLYCTAAMFANGKGVTKDLVYGLASLLFFSPSRSVRIFLRGSAVVRRPSIFRKQRRKVTRMLWYLRLAFFLLTDSALQFSLGVLLEEGKGGVKADLQQAAQWYIKACEKDHPRALVVFGEMVEKGKGVPQVSLIALSALCAYELMRLYVRTPLMLCAVTAAQQS